ncbi:MAG TPA: hypothetical protein VK753_12260 [Xanthomonadaceae bacterium]|jgi:hypothetical protein|nr:hypothetical protein [Xanthomonadaceae bacterium]
MRYLTETDAISTVCAGRAIEQFLPPREESNYRALRWVCVERNPDRSFSASRYEVFDEGDLNHLDLYAFSFVDPDEPCEKRTGFLSAEEAMKIAEEQFGANRCKYVNVGIVQDEYADFVRGRLSSNTRS